MGNLSATEMDTFIWFILKRLFSEMNFRALVQLTSLFFPKVLLERYFHKSCLGVFREKGVMIPVLLNICKPYMTRSVRHTIVAYNSTSGKETGINGEGLIFESV